MIWKRCSRCGRRVEEGKSCTCGAGRRRGENRKDGIRKEYHTAKWQRFRDITLKRYSYQDLYALYHDGEIRAADRVHHIIPVLDNPDGFYDTDNYFPCSDASHQEIHRRYRDEDPDRVQQELRRYLERYRTEA